MKNLKQLFAVLAFFSLAFMGCEKDETKVCNLDAEVAAYQKKINNFSANPTVSNCNALRQGSIDLLNKAQKCTGADKASIVDAVNIWKDLDCSEFD